MIPVRRYLPVISAIWLSSVALPSSAMVEISDDQMSDVSGAGLAFVFDNFSMRMAPTSFIELTGTAPQGVGWQRGDARYYGLSITDGVGVGGTDWYGNGCNTGSIAGALACPIGNANPNNNGVTSNVYGIGAAASVYDPYVLRVFQYPGHDYAGNYLTSTANMPTILELVGPSNTDTWRWAFWGELEVGRPDPYVSTPGTCNSSDPGCSGGANFLQSQSIIRGKPTTAADINGDGLPEPAILRLMRTTGLGASSDTLGLTYQSALSGDFRFSVRQNNNSPDALHYVPDFNDVEGMYFKNVDAFLPLGTLHYQAIVLDASGTNGNFTIELTQIPNIPQIYNNFYCGANNNANVQGCATDASGAIASPNTLTRGYVRWGDWTGVSADGTTGANLPGPTSTTNGIYYVGGTPGAETVTNLGISRIEGMRIHSLKITTLGAGI